MLKVPYEVYMKSVDVYLADDEKRTQFEAEINAIRAKNVTKNTELTREQVMTAVDFLNGYKFDMIMTLC